MKFVFVHIPKTAGTTFNMMMRQYYYANQVKTLRTEWELFHKKELLLKEIDRDILYNEYNIVKGHHPYYKLQYLKEEHGWKMITWIRDPIDRLISNYNHFVHRKHTTRKFNTRTGVKLARRMNIVKFSKMQSDFHIRYTGEDPSIFDFIGIVEQFDKSIQQFNKQFKHNLRMAERFNVHGWAKTEVTKNVRKQLMKHHEKDYEFRKKVMEGYK